MNKAFWLSILGDCWEKSICCSFPARLMEEFPALKVYLQPTTCNLVYLEVLPGVVDWKCNSPGQWRGRKGPDARNGGSTKIAENPETELLPKLLSIYWKFGSNFCRLINLSHSLSPYLTFIMKANGTHIPFEKTLTRGLLFWPSAYSWEYQNICGTKFSRYLFLHVLNLVFSLCFSVKCSVVT